MDIRQFRYLASLARERHFARAAEACGVAQPTLSAALRQLEDELGVPIVERGNRFKAFTPEGERVLAWAQRILADCEALTDDLATRSRKLSGKLRLGVIPTALADTAVVIRAFHEAHPHAGVVVRSLNSIEIQRGLEEFDLHAGITFLDNEPLTAVRTQHIVTQELVILARADAEIAAKGQLRWAEAAELPLCLLTPDMQHRRIVDAAFATAGATPRPILESNSILLLIAQVREAGYFAVAPRGLLAKIGVTEGLAILPLVEPLIRRSIGLAVPDRELMAPLTEALWEVVARLARAAPPSRQVSGLAGQGA